MNQDTVSNELLDSSNFRHSLTDEHGVFLNTTLSGSGRKFFGDPNHYISEPGSPTLRNLSLAEYSLSSWVWLDMIPEQRMNDVFFGLGYNQSPKSTFFDSPQNFLSLQPDGGRILPKAISGNGFKLLSSDEFRDLQIGISSPSGFMSSFLTRFTPTNSASYQFKIGIENTDFATIWLDLNQNGNFELDEALCRTDLPISQPVILTKGNAYNCLIAHGVPSTAIKTKLEFSIKFKLMLQKRVNQTKVANRKQELHR